MVFKRLLRLAFAIKLLECMHYHDQTYTCQARATLPTIHLSLIDAAKKGVDRDRALEMSIYTEVSNEI